MKNLKEIVVVVKTITTKTFLVSEDEGYRMPKSIQETLDFVNSVKEEALNYMEKAAYEIETSSQIESLKLVD